MWHKKIVLFFRFTRKDRKIYEFIAKEGEEEEEKGYAEKKRGGERRGEATVEEKECNPTKMRGEKPSIYLSHNLEKKETQMAFSRLVMFSTVRKARYVSAWETGSVCVQ